MPMRTFFSSLSLSRFCSSDMMRLSSYERLGLSQFSTIRRIRVKKPSRKRVAKVNGGLYRCFVCIYVCVCRYTRITEIKKRDWNGNQWNIAKKAAIKKSHKIIGKKIRSKMQSARTGICMNDDRQSAVLAGICTHAQRVIHLQAKRERGDSAVNCAMILHWLHAKCVYDSSSPRSARAV